jgi:hypothetical protein
MSSTAAYLPPHVYLLAYMLVSPSYFPLYLSFGARGGGTFIICIG